MNIPRNPLNMANFMAFPMGFSTPRDFPPPDFPYRIADSWKEQFEMHETMSAKAPVILGGHEHIVFEEVRYVCSLQVFCLFGRYLWDNNDHHGY